MTYAGVFVYFTVLFIGIAVMLLIDINYREK
jgi:hypothetical protein